MNGVFEQLHDIDSKLVRPRGDFKTKPVYPGRSSTMGIRSYVVSPRANELLGGSCESTTVAALCEKAKI